MRSSWSPAESVPALGLLVLTLGSELGCGTHSVIGLKPVAPRASVTVPVVDSLQPTLEWTPHILRRATYDLRVYRAEQDAPAEIVYARNDLPAPAHTLDAPLEPSRLYFWTVRARLELGGQVKVTDWGVLKIGPPEHHDPALALVPHPSYYRFKTPKSAAR